MRYITIIFFTLLVINPVYAELINIGATAPDWTLSTKEGKTLSYYEDSEDKVSVILFWATWCPYCATLMPHMEVVYRKYKNKGLKFYAIDIYEDGDIDPVKYFENREYTYTLLLDGDEVAVEYDVRGTPGVYVVDKNKKVIYKRPGGVSDVLVKQNVDLKIKKAIAQ